VTDDVKLAKKAWVWTDQQCKLRFDITTVDYEFDVYSTTLEKLSLILPVVPTVGLKVDEHNSNPAPSGRPRTATAGLCELRPRTTAEISAHRKGWGRRRSAQTAREEEMARRRGSVKMASGTSQMASEIARIGK